jgi:hypothetical protein
MMRRIAAYNIARYGPAWSGSIPANEREALAKHLHVVCLPSPIDMSGSFLRLLRERAAEIPDLGWIALDPLGRFLFRGEDGRLLRFVDGEYAAAVTDFCAELAAATGACVTPVHHMRRAARQALREGGDAARAVRADPYGSELLLSFARFSLGLEPIAKAADHEALHLGIGRTWLRLVVGKSNHGDPDVMVIAERSGGAVRLVDMRAVPLEQPDPPAGLGISETPASLGFVVGEMVSVTKVTKALLRTDTNPNDRQRAKGDKLLHAWADRGWARPQGTAWRVIALGDTEAAPNA